MELTCTCDNTFGVWDVGIAGDEGDGGERYQRNNVDCKTNSKNNHKSYIYHLVRILYSGKS